MTRRTMRVCPRADGGSGRLRPGSRDSPRPISLRRFPSDARASAHGARGVPPTGISNARFSAAATASVSWGLTISARSSSFAAPANCDSTSTPDLPDPGPREFLGDQIHAVAQRRDHGDMGGAIEAREHCARIGTVDIADRRPGRVAETAIDLADEAGHLAFDLAILLDVGAALRRDLQQRHLAAPLRIVLEQPFERVDPVGDAFRIVERSTPRTSRFAPRLSRTSAIIAERPALRARRM